MPTLDDDMETISSALRQGLIIKISGIYPFETPHPHRFVILNADPSTEVLIVAPHATHQVQVEAEKAYKQGEDSVATVPVISGGKYSFFPKQTAFNCNELHQMTIDKLAEAMNNGELHIQFHESLDAEDLERLINGALASTQISPMIASLITGIE